MIGLEEFIKRSEEKHGGRYDYSLVSFKKVTDKVKIICPEHGVFEMEARTHYRGQGCPKCGIISRGEKKRDTTKSFIKKARGVHGDRYDYSKVKYKDSKTRICIICPEHGEFWQIPNGHLSGQGCPKCGKESGDAKHSLGRDEFIRRSIEKHGNKYDYSNVEYVNQNTPVRIICPEHGEFLQKPVYHQNGHGCPICAIIENAERRKYTLREFVELSNSVHDFKYDYTRTKYDGIHKKVTITCPVHGDFRQTPSDHISGCGCPKCGATLSKSEIEIGEYIENVYGKKIIRHDRETLGGNEIDILIPDKKIGIEFDGLFWHCEKNITDPNYHLKKTEECEKKGIRLIHIFEDEWLYKKDIVKSRLQSILGVSERIYARKCHVKEITNSESKKFLEETHIQGGINSKYSYGLFYNDEIIAVMTFGNVRKNLGRTKKTGTYELLRFSTKIGISVVGGAGKLLKYFVSSIHPKKIVTYADRRWSSGNLYEKLGFTFIKNTKPSYFYVINDTRKNRFAFRKDVLVSKYGCKKEETEHSFCLGKHWYRIYDCGTKSYEMKIKEDPE